MTDADAVGFTGVEWELRTPEELARALTTGPGPGQAGELSAAWSSVAAELEAVASEYRRLAVELSADWISEATPHLDDRSREVAEDVFALARHARELSDRAAAHAHDHAIARAAMPRAEEIAITGRALDALDTLGPGLAGVLSGATDALESARGEQRRAAARVMADYEGRTATLAAPADRPESTRHLMPALARQRDGVGVSPAPAGTGASPATASTGSGPTGSLTPAAATPLVPFAATGVGAGHPSGTAGHPSGAQVRPATAGAPTSAPPVPGAGTDPTPGVTGQAADRVGSGVPMVPPVAGAGAAAGASCDDEHHVEDALRPVPGPTEIEELYGLSVAVAPAVFGGASPAPLTAPVGGESA